MSTSLCTPSELQLIVLTHVLICVKYCSYQITSLYVLNYLLRI